MSIYDEMQELSQELFNEFQQGNVSYIQSVAGNGPVDDPGNPIETKFTLKGATVRGVFFKYVSGGLAVASDLQISHAVDSRFEIDKLSGFYEIDGKKHKIINVIKKPAAGVTVAFTCIVRS